MGVGGSTNRAAAEPVDLRQRTAADAAFALHSGETELVLGRHESAVTLALRDILFCFHTATVLGPLGSSTSQHGRTLELVLQDDLLLPLKSHQAPRCRSSTPGGLKHLGGHSRGRRGEPLPAR